MEFGHLLILLVSLPSAMADQSLFGSHDSGRPLPGGGRHEAVETVAPSILDAVPQAPHPSLLRPHVTDYDIGNSAVMSWLSLLAYLQNPDGTTDIPAIARALNGWGGRIEAIDDSPVQGFILWTAQGPIVVFRGSDQLKDWIDNAQAVFRPKLPFSEASIENDVHFGFSQQAKRVHDQILAKLNGYQGHRVWFAGHSLGGALASVFARDFHESHGFAGTGLYTFGAPRAGNNNHADYFTTHSLPAHRLEYEFDPVPGLPSPLLFRSVGDLTHIRNTDTGCESHKETAAGQVFRQVRARVGLLNPIPGRNSAADHSIANYVNCLMSIANSQQSR